MELLLNFFWGLGIRAFRFTRRANLAPRLESVFLRLASLVPATEGDVVASLPTGAQLRMPPKYRDARTVVVGLFQHDETRLLEGLTRPGMTFVDVGAYIGYFTVIASKWVGPSGRVYAFEPNSHAYGYLVNNVRTNNCSNVVAINKAVSDLAGSTALVLDPTGPESYVTDAVVRSAVAVETISLDSFCAAENWPRIDLVKMNIEGAEFRALRGMVHVSRRNPQLCLVMEFNPAAMMRSGVSPRHLETALTDLGFNECRIVERNLSATPAGELVPRGSEVYNLLLTKQL